MRLAWCTPTLSGSAIGTKSELAVIALRERGVEVDVWFPPGAGGRERLAGQREMTPGCENTFGRYDAVIYCVGDHAGYHGRIVEAAWRAPGIIIVHDVSLANLFNGMATRYGVPWLRHELRRASGPAAEQFVMSRFRQPGGWPGDPDSAQTVPMLASAVRSATAILTHSRFAAERLHADSIADVSVAWLPTPVAERDATAGSDGWFGTVRLPGDRPIVLQVGNLNPNKHTDVVIEAFARNRLSRDARLVIAGDGPLEVTWQLRKLIDRLDLNHCVNLIGRVNDATVRALRSRAEVSVVLRDPCLEAASAGLLDAFAYGLPCVAVDHGMYAEVPASIVRLVAPPPTSADVADAIRFWLDDAHSAAEGSAEAVRFTSQTCSAASYVDVVLRTIQTQGAASTRQMLTDGVSSLLADLHLVEDEATVQRVVDRAHSLFSARPARLPSVPVPDHVWLAPDAAAGRDADRSVSPAPAPRHVARHEDVGASVTNVADGSLRVSFAQNAEDIVLERGLRADVGFYVDIGAYDPTEDSVTKRFYDRGWRGVNVDPLDEVIRRFDAERTRDINVAAAISTSSGTALLWHGPSDLLGHSTLESAIATAHTDHGTSFESSSVRRLTLVELFEAYVPPGATVDFLKIDVEGHEHAVLASGDFGRWRPRVVVVECMAPYVAGSTHASWEHYLLDAGYLMVLFDGLNRFYVAEGEPGLAEALGSPASVIDEFERAGVRNLRRRVHDLEDDISRLNQHVGIFESRSRWLERRLRFVGVDEDETDDAP